MPKIAKEETPQPTNSQVKEYVKRLRAVNAEIKDYTDSRKDLLAEAKAKNWILETTGQGRLFI